MQCCEHDGLHIMAAKNSISALVTEYFGQFRQKYGIHTNLHIVGLCAGVSTSAIQVHMLVVCQPSKQTIAFADKVPHEERYIARVFPCLC